MRTAKLTGRIFGALISLAAAAMLLQYMAGGRSDMDKSGILTLGNLAVVLGFAAYNIACVINTATEES